MKVCITCTGTDLSSEVDRSFGRARYYLFVDSETGSAEAVANSPSAHGAGVQAAQLMAENGAEAVITGDVGPNAHQGLSVAGIGIFVGASGTAQKALEDFEANRLRRADLPTRRGHTGGGR
jgi:predicted Fe-Mo cluster-binding NifX family protein